MDLTMNNGLDSVYLDMESCFHIFLCVGLVALTLTTIDILISCCMFIIVGLCYIVAFLYNMIFIIRIGLTIN